MSNAATYDQAKQRIADLVTGRDEDTPTGACPGWSVKDVVAHLGGGLRDFIDRRFDGVQSGEWGERQVRERKAGTMADAFAEWDKTRELAEPLFDTPMGSVLVTEVVMHEHDLRAALGEPGERDNVAVRSALTRPLQELDKRMRENDVPALRLHLEHGERVIGGGEPAGALRTSSFELLRAIGGRRSAGQVRAMEWDGDPDTWLATLALFGTHRTADFIE
jgi:uncharacterized protein (TIGR03083 family)